MEVYCSIAVSPESHHTMSFDNIAKHALVIPSILQHVHTSIPLYQPVYLWPKDLNTHPVSVAVMSCHSPRNTVATAACSPFINLIKTMSLYPQDSIDNVNRVQGQYVLYQAVTFTCVSLLVKQMQVLCTHNTKTV